MKVLIIAGASLRLCPYAFFYINALEEKNCNITVAYWDRDGQPDIELDDGITVYSHHALLDDSTKKWKKVKYFLGFRSFISKLLRGNRSFDLIIALDTQFAVLFSDILIKKYCNKFIYDMRDPSYEQYGLFRKRVQKIVDAASAVFISSDGYRELLPARDNIYTIHNLRMNEIQYKQIRRGLPRAHTPIRMSFWGVIRDVGINLAIIKTFKNDDRFDVKYYGTITDDTRKLMRFCESNRILNVHFEGSYLPMEKMKFVKETDIICNLYSNQYSNGNPCMGNKFYDGILFCLPQICSSGSYMGNMCDKESVGLSLQIDEDMPNTVYDYYQTIDWPSFEHNCDVLLGTILEQQSKAQEVLNRIIGNA